MANVNEEINTATAIWYYASEDNPWPNESTNSSHERIWTKYRDLEIDIIEEAYQRNERDVRLDRYRVDIKYCIQFNLDDETKQRPVKRESKANCKTCLRESRFNSILTSNPSTVESNPECWCPFLLQWLHSPSGKRAFLDMKCCIEQCAQGIIQEGELSHTHSKAEALYMAAKFRQYSGKPRFEIAKLSIYFYTKDSFLYFTLNKALRENDFSKLNTLGPFCYLLCQFYGSCDDFSGTVYRGVQLEEDEIQKHKDSIGEWRSWAAYTSTSKDRRMAEMFGNVLFIIEIINVKISTPRSYDISIVSSYPDEQEVLLPAGVAYKVLNVVQTDAQKCLIYVKV